MTAPRARVVHWSCTTCGQRGDSLTAAGAGVEHLPTCDGTVATLTRTTLRDEIATQVGRWA